MNGMSPRVRKQTQKAEAALPVYQERELSSGRLVVKRHLDNIGVSLQDFLALHNFRKTLKLVHLFKNIFVLLLHQFIFWAMTESICWGKNIIKRL